MRNLPVYDAAGKIVSWVPLPDDEEPPKKRIMENSKEHNQYAAMRTHEENPKMKGGRLTW